MAGGSALVEARLSLIMRRELPMPPAGETLGIVFTRIDAEAGTIEVEFEARPQFANPAGNIQGGFLAAMLDDTMGPALAAVLAEGQFAATLNLNVSYERRVLRRGKDVCFLAGELFQDGQRVASATATAIIRPLSTS